MTRSLLFALALGWAPLHALTPPAARFPDPVPAAATPVRTAADLDAALDAAWSAAGVVPTPAAAPEAWLRRVTLDLAGRTPTPAEVRAFRADGSPAARARVILAHLGDPAWAAQWGRRLTRPLLSPRASSDGSTARALGKYLSEQLARSGTWNAVARGLIAATGSTATAPAAAFRAQFAEAAHEVAGQLGGAVYGMRLRCAQCHDDPLHGWSVKDYYGLAAFFGSPKRMTVPAKLYESWRAGKVRTFYDVVSNLPEMRPRGPDHRWVRRDIEGNLDALRELSRMGMGGHPIPAIERLDWGAADVYRIHAQRKMAMKEGGFGRTTSVLSDKEMGDLRMPALPVSPLTAAGAPAKGQPVPLRWPNDPTRPAPAANRRAALAAWTADPKNELVARCIVNRVWFELMGRGLVEPVDEVVRPQDARHAALLARLADGLRQRDGDLRWLCATITGSRAYALTGAPGAALPRKRAARAHHGTEIEVRAPVAAPEQLFAVRQARPLAVAEVEAALRQATGLDTRARPELTKALSRQFDPDANGSAIDGESSAPRGGLTRGLFLLGPDLHKLVEESPALKTAAADALDDLFVAALGRSPTAAESARVAPAMATPRGRADVLWALVSSAEFLTNH